MNFDMQKLMEQATRLTRSGRLQEAAQALRTAMLGQGSPTGGHGPQVPGTVPADVIDVAARRVDADAPAMAPRPAAAAPAGFTSHSFANAADRRDYKLYVPAGDRAGPMPLVVMLHGCTQNPDDFAAGTRMNMLADAQGFVVLYPAQSRKANPHGCWNWFKHTHQTRDRGEPALIAGMVREVIAGHAIDPGRVYAAGLSAGGAMAAILGETSPDLFAAVGVHSGLAAGVAQDLPAAMSLMNTGAAAARRAPASGMPTIVFQGDADPTVHAQNARGVVAASVGAVMAGKGEASTVAGSRSAQRELFRDSGGKVVAELWMVKGGQHAWFGGGPGSYSDPNGPDASAEMLRFFGTHRK